MSTTPALNNAAVMISKPRIMMTVSLPNPTKALGAGNSPVRIRPHQCQQQSQTNDISGDPVEGKKYDGDNHQPEQEGNFKCHKSF
jgi:hypothetical protein